MCVCVVGRSLSARWQSVSVGGVSDLSTVLRHAGDVTTSDFVGCLRDVTLAGPGDLLLPDDDVTGVMTSQQLSRDSCGGRPARGQCAEHLCANGGLCVDEWTGYRCQCALGFAGQNCTTGLLKLNELLYS